uniref:Protein jag n=1 Tax=Pseudothermotoga hypogea TaxID=57487 RepID=A0A832MM12_9THEM
MKKVRISAPTVEEALQKAKERFDLREGEYEYTIIDKGSKGIFGLFSKDAEIEINFNSNYFTRKLEEFLSNALSAGGDVVVKVSCSGRRFLVELDGSDLGRLIGKHGKTLAALQHVAMIYLNRMSDTKLSVSVDAGQYKKRRKKNLEAIVKQAIQRAKLTKGKVMLDPMFAFERRMVHEIVKRHKDVKSYSVGVEPYRKVVIEYSTNGKNEEEDN